MFILINSRFWLYRRWCNSSQSSYWTNHTSFTIDINVQKGASELSETSSHIFALGQIHLSIPHLMYWPNWPRVWWWWWVCGWVRGWGESEGEAWGGGWISVFVAVFFRRFRIAVLSRSSTLKKKRCQSKPKRFRGTLI